MPTMAQLAVFHIMTFWRLKGCQLWFVSPYPLKQKNCSSKISTFRPPKTIWNILLFFNCPDFFHQLYSDTLYFSMLNWQNSEFKLPENVMNKCNLLGSNEAFSWGNSELEVLVEYFVKVIICYFLCSVWGFFSANTKTTCWSQGHCSL